MRSKVIQAVVQHGKRSLSHKKTPARGQRQPGKICFWPTFRFLEGKCDIQRSLSLQTQRSEVCVFRTLVRKNVVLQFGHIFHYSIQFHNISF